MIFKRRSRSGEEPQPETTETRESSRAREYSEQRLRLVQESWPEVQRMAQTFRKMRVDNHFADRIREAHQP